MRTEDPVLSHHEACSNTPCLALLQAPGNWPLLQRSCLKASTTAEICTNKNKRDTGGDTNSTSQVKYSHVYSTSKFAGSLREWEQDGFCQLAKQNSTARSSKKQRTTVSRAWIKVAKFPEGWEAARILAVRRLMYSFWLLASKNGRIFSKVFQFGTKRKNTVIHLT